MEANKALFSENLDDKNKEYRVKFKEDLVDFEPDVTDDDVASIESYNESIDYSVIHNEIDEAIISPLETKLIHNVNLPIFKTVEEEEREEEIIEEDEITSPIKEEPLILNKKNISQEESDETEEIEEALQHDDDEESAERTTLLFKQQTIDMSVTEENEEIIPTIKVDANVKDSSSKATTISSRKSFSPVIRKRPLKQTINCKIHCIEKLDYGLDLSINKLRLNEKPPKDCPALKLQKRNCCEKNPTKLEQKLPDYCGFKSEYGLSLAQLESRQRLKHLSKMRERKRSEILEEFKQRKMEQNEEIFCQWLKNISKRKKENENSAKNSKKCSSLTVADRPNCDYGTIKQRSKTAHTFPLHNVKKIKRPRTSPGLVYIEVPHTLLEKGVKVGDIFVREDRLNDAKKLNIMTLY